MGTDESGGGTVTDERKNERQRKKEYEEMMKGDKMANGQQKRGDLEKRGTRKMIAVNLECIMQKKEG